MPKGAFAHLWGTRVGVREPPQRGDRADTGPAHVQILQLVLRPEHREFPALVLRADHADSAIGEYISGTHHLQRLQLGGLLSALGLGL